MSNEKLLNVFVAIAFHKTPLYDAIKVIATLDLVEKWFTTIYKDKKIIPPSFDFSFFLKAIELLINLNHGVSTAKCVWLLYKIHHTIPGYQRSIISEQLLSDNKFYDLFFHWSWNVRQLFCYLFFFQFFHKYNNLSQVAKQEDITAAEREYAFNLNSKIIKIDNN